MDPEYCTVYRVLEGDWRFSFWVQGYCKLYPEGDWRTEPRVLYNGTGFLKGTGGPLCGQEYCTVVQDPWRGLDVLCEGPGYSTVYRVPEEDQFGLSVWAQGTIQFTGPQKRTKGCLVGPGGTAGFAGSLKRTKGFLCEPQGTVQFTESLKRTTGCLCEPQGTVQMYRVPEEGKRLSVWTLGYIFITWSRNFFASSCCLLISAWLYSSSTFSI